MAPFVAAILAAAFAVSTNAFSTKTTTIDKHEAKFERMIDELKLPPATIEFIDSSKQRLLFRGVAAAVQEPQILNAFGIVYKDLAPVRVAGDIIFSQLASVATEATELASGVAALPQKDDAVEGDGAVDAKTLAKFRQIFDLLDGDNSGGIDRTELLASPVLMALLYDYENDVDADAAVDRFMKLADENGDGVISFVEFAYAVATQPRLQLVDDALASALKSSTFSGEGKPKKKGRFGRKTPEERFEAMIQTCLVWEQDLGCAPTDDDDDECAVDVLLEQDIDEDEDSRLLQVLKGSLVGVHCEPVLEALKMCYLEYSPLRFGGDVIFKLLKQVVASQTPKKK